MKAEQPPKSVMRFVLNFIYIAVFLMVIAGVFLGPTNGRHSGLALQSSVMQRSRAIGVSMFVYSNDHNGHYPEGKTSTEVFQHLIDEKYVDDPSVFYVEMPGKILPHSNQLHPENVSFDVTCCLDSSAPDNLPVVFLTGYKITYLAGASAVLVDRSPRTWDQWWNGPEVMKKFIAVCYKDNSAKAIKADEDGSIPNFIPADFDPKGKTYRQLTP